MQNKTKIRVMGFDGWALGAHHYVRLLEAFREYGIELLLVHLGSWGDDKNRSTEEIIDGLLVRDISYYRTQSFRDLLHCENPDVVILLSTETFLHRAFLRYCKKLGIPTIHLFHGLVNVVPFVSHRKVVRFNILNSISYKVERSVKFFNYSLPIYMKGLFDTGGGLQEWLRLAKDVVMRAGNKLIIIPAADSATSKYCVYTEADFDIVFKKWRCSANDVVAVGNPDIIGFEKLVSTSHSSHYTPNPFLIYIDSHITHQGLFFRNESKYVDFISELSSQLNRKGLRLKFKIKPHPPERAIFIANELGKRGIRSLSNEEFREMLPSALGVITEPSTLALVPCLLGLRLLLVKIGPLAEAKYGDVLETYPNSRSMKCFDDIADYLGGENQGIRRSNGSIMESWLKKNAGPMPASDMPKRVAEVVLELARSRDTH